MTAPSIESPMASVNVTSMAMIGMNLEKTMRPAGSEVRWPSQPRIARKIAAGMPKSSGTA